MTANELEAAAFAASEISTMLLKASRRAISETNAHAKSTKLRHGEIRLALAVAEALDRTKRLAKWIEDREAP